MTAKEIIKKFIERVKRKENFTEFSREVGLGRETIYRAFNKGSDPRLSSLIKLANGLNLELKLVEKKSTRAQA